MAAMGFAGLVALAACGGSSGGDDEVAALDGAATTTSDDAQAASADPEQAALDFAECMRSNGLPEFQDPQVNADGTIQFQGGGFGTADREVLRQAMEACQPILQEAGFQQGGGGGQGPGPELQDALLEFAQCMRDNGINMPDPDFSGGGGRGFLFGGGNVDSESPAFQEAMEVCQPILQDAGFGPGGGGGDG